MSNFLEKTKKEIEKYKKIFQIPEDFQIEVEEMPQGHELTFYPEEKKAVIKLDKDSISDIPELIAQLKMGIEYHPLLATFYFQPDLTKQEEFFASSFYTLVIPLIDAWVWKVMKDYLPEEELEKQVKELKTLWEVAQLEKMRLGDVPMKEALRRRMSFSQYLIFRTLGYDAELQLQVEAKNEKEKKKLIQEWVRYKKALENFAKHEPNIKDILELPKITKAPFSVKAVDSKYYEVKKLP